MLLRRLYTAASRAESGAVIVGGEGGPGPARLELQRGFVYALWFAGSAGRHRQGEENLRELLDRHGEAQARFESGAQPSGRGRTSPFHPAQLLRNHVEGRLGPEAGRSFRRRVGGEPLHLHTPPHPSCLGFDERGLVALLAAPRRLDELDRLAPPLRVERLLAFLDGVAALTIGRSPFAVLGLAEGASGDEVRRTYKRLARELHPDLQPELDERGRRTQAERFAEVVAAYRALVGG